MKAVGWNGKPLPLPCCTQKIIQGCSGLWFGDHCSSAVFLNLGVLTPRTGIPNLCLGIYPLTVGNDLTGNLLELLILQFWVLLLPLMYVLKKRFYCIHSMVATAKPRNAELTASTDPWLLHYPP